MPRILVIDDDLSARESARLVLADQATVRTASFDDDVLTQIAREPADLLLVGLSTPLDRPLRVLREVLLADPNVRVMVLVERDLMAAAQRIFDYRVEAILPKPFDPHALRRRVGEVFSGHDRIPTLRESMEAAESEEHHTGPDLAVLLPAALRPFFARSAQSNGHVVIEGEPGTGKSALAHRLHLDSPWRNSPYARVDAWALTEARLDAVLTRLATNGTEREHVATLCIEELALLAPEMHPLLRDLAEGNYPPGTHAPVRRMTLRLLITTTESLADLAARGALPRELRDAIAVLVLRLPPLRSRKGELSDLCAVITDELARRYAREPVRLSQDALDKLHIYLWPGNLRELRTVLARAIALTDNTEVSGDAVHFIDEVLPFPAPPLEQAVEEGPPTASAQTEEPARNAPAVNHEPDSPTPETAPWGLPPPMELVAQLLAHEVKNPLVAIKTFTQLLRDKFDDAEFRDRFYEIVSGDVARIDSLVEAATAYSRLEAPSPEPVDIGVLFDDVLKEFERSFLGKRILVLREGLETRPRALADPAQLRYAIRCIIAKSVDLMPEGADLQIGFQTVAATAGTGSRLAATLRIGGAEGMMADMAPLGERKEGLPGNLEMALAREVLMRQDGALRIDMDDPRAAVVTIDLPAA
ncbi:MAG: response regulator [Deltaproteobacteria bacterium]|nr:response regulator [Deltaproteobacteria bacterium]